MGIVTITNQSIIDSGTNVSVTLENQSLFSLQRKTLLGLDAQYQFNKDFSVGATLMHFSEKSLTEKVNIGDEVINNTMWGVNLSYRKDFMWLTNLLNKVPTINAKAPSNFTLNAEFAQLIPHKQKSGSNRGRALSMTSRQPRQVSTSARHIPGSWPRLHMTPEPMPCSPRPRCRTMSTTERTVH